MTDPWTDPDPKPGDFDADLTDIPEECVERHAGERGAGLRRAMNLTTRPRPCEQCPWRMDTERGRFPAARYEELAATTGTPEQPVPFGSPIFTCHKSKPDGGELPCAGWLAAVGRTNLTIRLALLTGGLEMTALEAGEDWPPLFETYAEMAEAQGGEGNKWAACFEEGCRDYGTPQTAVAGFSCPTCGRGKMVDVDDAMLRRGDY